MCGPPVVVCTEDKECVAQARRTEILSIQSEVNQLPAVERVKRHLANDNNIRTVNYTISAWDGGKSTFNYCSLENRAPVYAGVCTPKMAYTLTSVDTAPYSCTSFPNGTTLTGEACTAHVDKQLDCIAVCECFEEDALSGTVTRGCDDNR